jgi:acyl-CoA synthetase (AMP-forming)/AMP-acid ligase II
MHPRLFARTDPDHAAVVIAESGETLSYGGLEEAANQAAHLFRAIGLKRGEVVAAFLDNTPQYFVLAWATQRCGLYLTTISSRLTAGEAAYIVGDSGARALVASSSLAEVASAVAAAPEASALACRLAVDGLILGFEDWTDSLSRFPTTPVADESAGTYMFYSSGTTGRPKGVPYPLPEGAVEALDAGTALRQPIYGWDRDTIYFHPAPLYHAAPLGFGCMIHRCGGTVLLAQRFDAEEALAFIERYRVTHSQWVPTMFVRFLKLPPGVRERHDLSSMTVAIHAAAPCSRSVKRQMMAWWGPILHEFYSGTEASGVTMIGPEEWLAKPGSVGKARVGVIHIVDDAGDEVPAGHEGAVYFEGGLDFKYLNDPAKTAESRLPGRTWSTMGDLGYVDEDGYLFLTDRKAYMIVTGGVNVYPQEVEDVLIAHPDVIDAAVFGVPNAEFGEEVKAVIQPAIDAPPTDELTEALRNWCRDQLSPVKHPRSFEFQAQLPREPTGKLLKRQLRDPYWADHGSRIA